MDPKKRVPKSKKPVELGKWNKCTPKVFLELKDEIEDGTPLSQLFGNRDYRATYARYRNGIHDLVELHRRPLLGEKPRVRHGTRAQAKREGYHLIEYNPETKFYQNFELGLHKVALENWKDINRDHLEDITDGTGRKVRVHGGERLLNPIDIMLVVGGGVQASVRGTPLIVEDNGDGENDENDENTSSPLPLSGDKLPPPPNWSV